MVQLLENSVFVQKNAGYHRRETKFLKFTINLRDLQSMAACSAMFSTVLGRAAEPQGHVQYEWQWAQHDLHSSATMHRAAEHGTVPNTWAGGGTRCPPEGASSLEGGDCPV